MDLSAFGEPGNKFLDSDIIEVFHLLPYPCHDCILDLIVIIKILSSKMFFWLHKQVIVAWCKVWALGWMGQNFPLEGLQQLLWWCEKCVDRHYCAVGRPFALAFLTVCFVSCNRFFSGFRSKHQHIWRLLKAESWQEMAPSCPRIWLPWFFMLMWRFEFFYWQGMCVEPLHWVSLILRCMVRHPCFISRHSAVQKIVTLILVMCEKCLHCNHSFFLVIVCQHFQHPMYAEFPIA